MNAEKQMMEKSNSSYFSTKDECRIQGEAVRLNDTILIDEVVMVNPTSLTITHEEIEDTKVDTDGNFLSTRVFPGVLLDSESSKENHLEISSPHICQEIDMDFSSTRVFPSVPFDSEASKEIL